MPVHGWLYFRTDFVGLNHHLVGVLRLQAETRAEGKRREKG